MASASGISAGQAYITLTANDAQLSTALVKSQGKLKAFAKSAEEAGRKLATFGTLASMPFIAATKVFADFDDQMRMVAAVTGATGDDFELLTEKAKKLGRETSFTAAQVAQGMLSLGRMGFSTKEIDGSIQAMMNLAKVTGTDLGMASEIAANQMRVFRLSADQSSNVADLLSTTANGSAQTLQDLGEALKMAGPQAAAAGEDIRDVCSALGVMANLGIKGSLAGTALRKAYSQFASTKVQDFLKDYNIKTVDANGNLRKMEAIIYDLAGAMQKMGTAQKLQFAEEVFDVRGSLAGLSLTADTTAIDAFKAKLADCEGSAQASADKMESGIGGSLRRLASAFEGVSIAIGEALNSSIVPLAESFAKAFVGTAEWIKKNAGLVKSFAAVTASAGAVGLAIQALCIAGKGIGVAFTPIVSVLKWMDALVVASRTQVLANMAVATSSKGVSVALYAKAVAAKAATGAMTALRAAMTAVAMHPVTAALLVLVAALASVQYIVNRTNASFRQLSETAAQATQKASKALQAGDDKRAKDNAAFERLKQLEELSAQSRLTAKEIAEAQNLINSLGQYGADHFANLDALTGKLTLAADAQKQFNQAMRQAAIDELKGKYDAAQAEISRLAAENKNLDSFSNYTLFGMAGGWDDAAVAQVQKNADRIAALRAQMVADAKRLKALQGGDTSAAMTKKPEESTESKIQQELQKRAENVKAVAKAEETLAKIEKQTADAKLSALEKELQKIKETRAEYEKNMKIRMDDEKAMLAIAQKRADQNKNGKTAEQIAAYQEAVKEIQTRTQNIANLQTRLTNARAAFTQQESQARINDANQRQKAQKPYADFLTNMDRDKAQKEARSKQDAQFAELLKQTNGRGTSYRLDSFISSLQAEIAKARQNYTQSFKYYTDPKSSKGQEIDQYEAEALRGMQKTITSRTEQLEDYKRQIREAMSNTANNRPAASKQMASFDAAALAALFNSNGKAMMTREERMARATEDTAKYTRQTAKNTKDMFNSVRIG